MSGPRPTVGRIVQYLQPVEGSVDAVNPVAAVITGVFEAGDAGDICTLTLFEPGQSPRPTPMAIRQGDTPGHWRFPPIQPVAK